MAKATSSIVLSAITLLAWITAAHAQLPGAMEVTCDVDRNAFRAAARKATEVTFRLWDSQSGGAQCGSDYVVAMVDLTVSKEKTDSFDGQSPRRFASISAMLGSDATPAQLCSGNETWMDVSVGVQTFTCDFSASRPQARRRLQSVAYAVAGQGPAGPVGPAGVQGPQGPTGPTGPQGPQGMTGTTGAQGPQGTMGSQGPAGTNGISCWDLNGNGQCDLASEDINLDGFCTVADCKGPSGGITTANGILDPPISSSQTITVGFRPKVITFFMTSHAGVSWDGTSFGSAVDGPVITQSSTYLVIPAGQVGQTGSSTSAAAFIAGFGSVSLAVTSISSTGFSLSVTGAGNDTHVHWVAYGQ